MKQYLVDHVLLDAIFNYLKRQPYEDVMKLMQGIMALKPHEPENKAEQKEEQA